MDIPVSCSCGKTFRAKPALAGKTVLCPGCKAPISIPAQSHSPGPPQRQAPVQPQAPVPAQAPVQPQSPANPAGVILVGCNCGQQFNVESQFAGQQVNCPACQTLCVIPNPSYPQPGAPQPMVQPSPFSVSTGQAPQAAYAGSYGRATYKTGLGLFIFAIAACVFAGGFGFLRVAEGIMEIRLMSMLNSGQLSLPSEGLTSFTTVLSKIGVIALLLGMLGIVVANVFCIMSPSPLKALGITGVCVGGTAAIMMLIFETIPTLGESMRLTGFSGDMVSDAWLQLFVNWLVIGTFLIFSIFMIYALLGRNRRDKVYQAQTALITFSIAAGVHFLLTILMMVGMEGKWVFYVFVFIRWIAHAAMIVGLIFTIKTTFESKAAF